MIYIERFFGDRLVYRKIIDVRPAVNIKLELTSNFAR